MDEVKCYFDITIAGQECGRIIFKLFNDKCPKTCENFRCLCTGEKGGRLNYKGSPIHRIVRNFIIQGGDITERNGKGGDSIYGGSFDDENLDLLHDEPYLLSMANRGPNTNHSQFFITTNEAPHLDGKNVVFGRVVSGLDTINKIERQEVDSKSRPLKEVIIKECGQLKGGTLTVASKQIDSTRGLKRKLSDSSNSSRHSFVHSRTPSASSGSSSVSCSTSSSSSHYSSSPSRRYSRSRRRKRTPCSSDSRSSSSGSESRSGSSASDARSKTSSETRQRSRKRGLSDSSARSFSSSSSFQFARKYRKKNRRLDSTRKVEDFKASAKAAQRSNRVVATTSAHPGYKCSVNLDEIPKVPVNRFLMRVPPEEEAVDEVQDDEEDNEVIVDRIERSNHPNSSEAGLSELRSDRDNVPDAASDNAVASTIANRPASVRQQDLSMPGRVVRGKGKFTFRNPSSPTTERRKSPPLAYRRRYNRNHHRFTRSRSRDRARSRDYSRRSPPRRSVRSSRRHD